MSSILDALEKLEATGGPQAPASGGAPGREPRPPWRTIVLVVVAVGAGAAGAFFALGGRPVPVAAPSIEVAQLAPPTLPVPETLPPVPQTLPPLGTGTTLPATDTTLPTTATTVPAVPTTTLKVTETEAPAVDGADLRRVAAPVPPPLPDDRERPWGSEPKPFVPPDPAVLAVVRAVPNPPPPVSPPPAPRASVPVPVPPAPDASQPRAIEEAPARPSIRVPPGAPRMRVSFLVYSSVSTRRSVALTIGDAGMTTLREGQESQGVEVVRIFPDRVDLRWQGETFTLEVRS